MCLNSILAPPPISRFPDLKAGEEMTQWLPELTGQKVGQWLAMSGCTSKSRERLSKLLGPSAAVVEDSSAPL